MLSSLPFMLETEPREDARFIRITGALDLSTGNRLRRALDSARLHDTTAVVDTAGISFIDEDGLAVLLEASDAANAACWAWFLVWPSPAVLRLVELSGTASRLPLVLTPGIDRSLT